MENLKNALKTCMVFLNSLGYVIEDIFDNSAALDCFLNSKLTLDIKTNREMPSYTDEEVKFLYGIDRTKVIYQKQSEDLTEVYVVKKGKSRVKE